MLKKNSLFPLTFGIVGAFLGLLLRYAYTGLITDFPFKNILHAHSHILLLGFIFNALLLIIWSNFTNGFDRISQRYYLALQGCLAMLMVAFILQGYAFYSILFSTLHLWISYILLIRLWKRLKCKKEWKYLIRVGIVFHFLSSLGPYMLGPLMVMQMQNSALYQQSIFFYLHFQYFGIFFIWMMAVFIKNMDINITKKHIFLLLASIICLFAHSLEYSFNHWLLSTIGMFGSLLLFGLLISFYRNIKIKNKNFMRAYFIVLFVSLINIVGSIPFVSQLVVDDRFILIAWLHFLFLGMYTPFIWLMLIKNIKASILKLYAIFFLISETFLVFHSVISSHFPYANVWLLFFGFLGIFLCLSFIHLSYLIKYKVLN
jgi:hypothetical protein